MLHTGFILRNKKLNTDLEICSFDNYRPLFRFFGKILDEYKYAEYLMTPERLHELRNQISPIYEELAKLPLNTVAYFDKHEYPDKYQAMFYDMPFNPITTGAGHGYGTRLIELFHVVQTLLGFIDKLNPTEYEIVCFYKP